MILLSPNNLAHLRCDSESSKISRRVVTHERVHEDAERLISIAADALRDARRAVALLDAEAPAAFSATEAALDTVAAAVERRDILSCAFVDAAAALVRHLRAEPEPAQKVSAAIRALADAKASVERVLDHIALAQTLDTLRANGLRPAAFDAD